MWADIPESEKLGDSVAPCLAFLLNQEDARPEKKPKQQETKQDAGKRDLKSFLDSIDGQKKADPSTTRVVKGVAIEDLIVGNGGT